MDSKTVIKTMLHNFWRRGLIDCFNEASYEVLYGFIMVRMSLGEML